jgi:predicted transcriptional regulator
MDTIAAALPEKALTETEFEMMQILWAHAPCSVREMLTHLAGDRQLAYTSVSTIVRILEQKGYVHSIKNGRGHVYEPIVSKESYQTSSVGRMVERVFDDAPAQLVRNLVSRQKLSANDLSEIRRILNEVDLA